MSSNSTEYLRHPLMYKLWLLAVLWSILCNRGYFLSSQISTLCQILLQPKAIYRIWAKKNRTSFDVVNRKEELRLCLAISTILLLFVPDDNNIYLGQYRGLFMKSIFGSTTRNVFLTQGDILCVEGDLRQWSVVKCRLIGGEVRSVWLPNFLLDTSISRETRKC